MDLPHLPTADVPDGIFQNWIDSLTCDKISNRSQKELKHMNAKIAFRKSIFLRCMWKENLNVTNIIFNWV